MSSTVGFLMGSSPLARGTPRAFVSMSRLMGLIPARAGNTEAVRLLPDLSRAHPRSRGEHSRLSPIASFQPGSSPLARGTPFYRPAWGPERGLIPARAGNTFWAACWLSRCWAHPRSRGEHFFLTVKSERNPGSSPLARGTLPSARRDAAAIGLIPARAGNTHLKRALVCNRRAHPRSRGEHR